MEENQADLNKKINKAIPIEKRGKKLPSLDRKKLFVGIAILIPLLLGSILFFTLNKNHKADKETKKTEEITNQKSTEKYETGFQNQETNPYLGTRCTSNPKVSFPNDFTDVNLISSVEPTIITPGNSRHRAWLNIKSGKVPIYAPVDSELVNGVYKDARGAIDYDLHFQVSCEIWYLINHVTEPVDKVKDLFPEIPQTDTRTNPPFKNPVKFKAGELIGYSTGTPLARNFDFGVFDLNHVNAGLPADEGSNYGKEINFICPFDVLPDSVRRMYYEKIIPSEKPFSNCKAY